MKQNVQFYSEGVRLDGDLYLKILVRFTIHSGAASRRRTPNRSNKG